MHWNHLRLQHLTTVAILSLSLLGLAACSRNDTGEVNLSAGWRFSVDSLDEGISQGWYRASLVDTAWQQMDAGASWESQGLESYDGIAWYRKRISVKDPYRPTVLFFRETDDRAQIWLNGKLIGLHEGSGEMFSVPLGAALDPGENVIAVRVEDDGGPGGLTGEVVLIPEEHLLSLYRSPYSDERARPSEDWVRKAVLYEVYLRSFSPEGTFEGLRTRIPELKDLGVTVIWLMPIHPIGIEERKGTLGSPYSVRDYYGINTEFGTEEDFQRLVKTIHDNGMRVILDLVANHTSWDNSYLQDHPEWYTTDDWGLILSPNTDWFDVADLNFAQAGVRTEMLRVMRYWVERYDIDGYRCDVAELVPLDFWEQARAELDRIKPVLLLSEGSLPEHHVGAFDITYAWNTYDILAGLLEGTLPPSAMSTAIEREELAFPGGSLRLRFNANHDKNAWDAPAVTKFTGAGMKLTSVLMFTIPGVPLVYNGQEVGNERRLDLFEKVSIDWTDENEYWPFYRNLCRLRREHPAFATGSFEQVSVPDSLGVFSFARIGRDETALVALNFGRDTVALELPVPIAATPPAYEYFSGERLEVAAGLLPTRLEPRGFRVFLFTR